MTEFSKVLEERNREIMKEVVLLREQVAVLQAQNKALSAQVTALIGQSAPLRVLHEKERPAEQRPAEEDM